MKIFKKTRIFGCLKKNWDVTLNLCTLLVNARYFGEYVNIFLGYRHGVRFDPISTDGVHYIDHRLYSGDDVVHYIWPSHAWLEVSLDLISIPAIPRCTLWAPTHHCSYSPPLLLTTALCWWLFLLDVMTIIFLLTCLHAPTHKWARSCSPLHLLNDVPPWLIGVQVATHRHALSCSPLLLTSVPARDPQYSYLLACLLLLTATTTTRMKVSNSFRLHLRVWFLDRNWGL
jgi:hypothetical protein